MALRFRVHIHCFAVPSVFRGREVRILVLRSPESCQTEGPDRQRTVVQKQETGFWTMG
jgi:hypothetical protein